MVFTILTQKTLADDVAGATVDVEPMDLVDGGLLLLHQTVRGVDGDVGREEFLEEMLAEDLLELSEGAEFLGAKALLGKFGIEGAEGVDDGCLVGNGSAMILFQLITWEDGASIGGISDGLLFEVLHPLFERR